MKQKIIIKNFGPIEEVEMEINDFAIFIGPQASGKSTIAKSVFFFLSLRDDLMKYLRNAFDDNNFDTPILALTKVVRNKLTDYFGSVYQTNKKFLLEFFYSENVSIKIHFEHEKTFIEVSFSEAFQKSLNDEIVFLNIRAKQYHQLDNKFLTSSSLNEIDAQRISYFKKVEHSLSTLLGFDGDFLFVPAGRSLLSTLSEQIQDISSQHLDHLTKGFIKRIDNSKKILSSSHFNFDVYNFLEYHANEETYNLAQHLVSNILIGEYFYDNEEGDKIRINDKDSIKLLFASSGQQEAVWIVQIILLLILNKQKVFIVIEEPEAHLFPEAQKNIIDLISLLANQNGNQVFITTHSPYLLTSLNNLIYAYQVGQQHSEKVATIIDKSLWLNPEKIKAYFVGGKDNKGRIRDIIDKELEIIRVEEIDTASRINNDKFDQLFDLV